MLTIGKIKGRLGRKFRGASIDDIQGVSDYSLFEEAGGNLLANIDPYETVRLYRFNQFDGVYDYSAPSYLKGKKLIDPRKQDGREFDEFTQTFTKDFDRDKKWKGSKVSVEYEDGVKVLRLTGRGKSILVVDETRSLTGWSAAGGGTNLELDEVIRLDGSDTLRVDLGATGGYIENSTLDAADLTDFLACSFFRKVYLPDVSDLTSIALRIGSSSGDYWTVTGTPQVGSYKVGVNIVRFDFEGATATGSPDISAVDYERIVFVTTASLADVRVGPLSARLPTPFEIPLYSNQIFREPVADGGAFLDLIEESSASDKDDVRVIFEKEAENLFFYECCILAAEDLSLDDEAEKFRRKLYGHPGKDDDGGLYGQYKRDKPGEALRPQTRYIELRSRRRPPQRW